MPLDRSVEPQKATTTTTAPIVTKVTQPSSCEAYRAIFNKYDWDVDTAIKICDLESSASSTRVNDNPKTGDYSVGLMQVNLYGDMRKSRPSEEVLKTVSGNIAYAYELYKNCGWRPWSTFKKISS